MSFGQCFMRTVYPRNVLVLIFTSFICAEFLSAQRPAVVVCDPVRHEDLQERRFVTGELRARERSSVAVREPGLVAHIHVREGMRVEAGSLLAQIDDRRVQLEKLQLAADMQVVRATLAEYEADLELATWQLEATRKLEKRGSAFEREVREAQAAIAMTRAKVAQQESQLEVLAARDALLDLRLEDMLLRAPFTGVCVKRHAERGQWLDIGSPAFDLVATGAIEAWFDVPQELAPVLAAQELEMEVRVEATGFRKSIREFRAVPELNVGTRTFPLVLELPNERDVLKAGMSATAWIPLGPKRAQLTLSKNALIASETGPFVYVARGPGENGMYTADPVNVSVTFRSGDRLVVKPGALRAEDLVVVEGNERLFPGTPLVVQPAPAKRGER